MKRVRKTFTTVSLCMAFLCFAILSSCQSTSTKQKETAGGASQTPQPASGSVQNVNSQPVASGQPQPPSGSASANNSAQDKKQDKKSGGKTGDANATMLNNFAEKSGTVPPTPPSSNMSPEMKKAHDLYQSGAQKAVDGDQEGAIEDFTQSLNIYKTPVLFMKRGFSELVAKQYGNALNDMDEALKLNPKLDRAIFGRGVARFEMGDFTTAEEDFKYYVERDKTEPMAFNYLAGCRFMQQDYKGALENYDIVAKLDAKYPDIYTNRGMMKHYLNDLKGAVEDYNKALAIDPENATAYNNRGGAKLNQQNYKGAIEDFDKAISIKKDYAEAYDNRAKAKMNQNDKAGACADWQKAYSLGMEASREMIIKYCGKGK